MGSFLDLPSSTISVTEIKVHARVSKEETKVLPGPSKKHAKNKRAPGETVSQKSSSEHVVGPKKSDKSGKADSKSIISLAQLGKKASDEKIGPEKDSKKKPTGKISQSKTGSIKRSTSVSSGPRRSDKYLMERHHTQSLLDMIEQKREIELRVIDQRTDSHVEAVKTPTPMASLDSTAEIQFEKLLLVERLPSRDADKKPDFQEKAKRLSLVTEEQFKKLHNKVLALQEILDPIEMQFLPENEQLMQGLRKASTLSEGMAVLQLTARLTALEDTISRMAGILTELIRRTTGANAAESTSKPWKMNINEEEEGVKKGTGTADTKILPFEKDVAVLHVNAATTGLNTAEGTDHHTNERPVVVSVAMLAPQQQQEEVYVQQWDMTGNDFNKYVTYEQFETSLQDMYDNFFKAVAAATARSNENAKNATLLANSLEDAIETSLGLGGRLAQLEDTIDENAAQMRNLDTGLFSQMAEYQEQLNQMQHDLESGLESMAEALANQGGETEAMTELTQHFKDFQADIDSALSMNKDLQELQDLMGLDLECVRKEMEVFSETKCDRDEIVDALKDKAGVKDLNGLVVIEYFEAVRSTIENNILKSYAKFNDQEMVWQKAITKLSKDIQDRAEIYQLESLAKDIQNNINMLKARIDGIEEILGEPKAVAITRRVFRDSACLSCSTPAHMDMAGPGMIPMLPPVRLPLIGAEAPSRPKEDGDHSVCYPGLPIPHARDPRADICLRYCGGSHTRQSALYSRMSPSMRVQHMPDPTFDLGSDGKSYMVDQEPGIQRPCYPCNLPKLPSMPLMTSLDESNNEVKIGNTAERPFDVCPCCLQHQKQAPERESYDRDTSSLTKPLDFQSQDSKSAATPVLYDYD